MLAQSGWLNDQRKIGLGLTAFGLLFFVLGMLLFFDRGLLAMGNLLFIAGLSLTIGVNATLRFFSRKKNRRGSAFYIAGVLLVVYGWTVLGFISEAVGFWFLFFDFIPTVLSYAKQLPVMNRLFDIPAVNAVFNRLMALGGLPRSNMDTRSR